MIRFAQQIRSTGEPQARSFTVAHRVADRFEPVVTRTFLGAINQVRASIDVDRVESVIASGGNIDAIMAEVMTGPLVVMANTPPQFFPLLEMALRRAIMAAGEGAAEVLSEALDVEFGFRATDPNVTTFARQQSGRLVKHVSDDVRLVIAEVIALGNEVGLTARQQADLIKMVVGLTPRDARAVARFAGELRAGQTSEATSRLMGDPLLEPLENAKDAGRFETEIRLRIELGNVTDEWVGRMAERYSRNLLHHRATVIARTETMTAANAGLRTGWRQAQKAGVLPKTTRRVVIVTPDERLRETHLRAMQMNYPDGVGLGDKFQTPWGLQPGPPWPADPYNCRCSEGLVFPGYDGVL